MDPGDFVITCPHCGAAPTAYVQHREPSVVPGRGGKRRWRLAACPACGGAAAFETTANNADEYVRHVPQAAAEEWSVSHLEEDVGRDWGEAIRVYKVEAFEAAVVMCGRTLEAAAEKLGIEGRSLQARINKMLEQDLITSSFGDAMDYVRLIRNVGAHAGKPVSAASAEGTMRFTQQALRLLFEVPGELHRLTETPEELDETPDDGPADQVSDGDGAP
jgi:hypothetical protein